MNQNTVTREECEAILNHNPSGAETQAVRLARAHLELLDKMNEDYIGWARWRRRGDNHQAYISICDSDAEGAFKIYRNPQSDELRSQKAALETKLNDALGAMNICADNQNAYSVEVFELKREKAALESQKLQQEETLRLTVADLMFRKRERDALESQLAKARKDTERLVTAAMALLNEYNLSHVMEHRRGYWLDLGRAIDAASALRAKPEA